MIKDGQHFSTRIMNRFVLKILDILLPSYDYAVLNLSVSLLIDSVHFHH